jgi:hypothetical protein
MLECCSVLEASLSLERMMAVQTEGHWRAGFPGVSLSPSSTGSQAGKEAALGLGPTLLAHQHLVMPDASH